MFTTLILVVRKSLVSGAARWGLHGTALAAAGQAFLRPEQLSAEAFARVSSYGNLEGLVLFNGLHHQVLDRCCEYPRDDSGELGSKDLTDVQGYNGSPGDDSVAQEGYEHCGFRGLDGNHGSSTSMDPEVSQCKVQVPLHLPQGTKVVTKIFHAVTRPPATQEMIGSKCMPFWRRTVDMEAQEVLENQFVTWEDNCCIQWDRSHNIECQLWYLPPTVAYCFSWSDSAEHFCGLDLNLQPCQEGPLWLMQSSYLTHMLVEEGKEIPHDRYERDLRTCHRNLLSLISDSSSSRSSSTCDIAELFSPPRIVPMAQERGLQVQKDHVFDLEAGWDVRKKSCRDHFREFQRKKKPGMLMESPECKAYSQLMNVNWGRMNPSQVRQIISEGKLMWDFAVEAAEEQYESGDYFAIEHPARATSWSTPRIQRLLAQPGVALIEFDMCAFNLSVVQGGELSQKPTRVATNNPWLALKLALSQCSQDHSHVPLQNGLPAKARIYTPEFCAAIVEATRQAKLGVPIRSFLQFLPYPSGSSHFSERRTFVELPEEEEEEENPGATAGGIEGKEQTIPARQITEAQKRLVHKVHVNTGHPPMDQFLRMLKAAGTHEHVLKFVREEYACEQCGVKVRKDNRRRAHCPRSFSFNKVLSIDVFYVHFSELRVPILNMVCAGTNYHITQRLSIPEGMSGGTPTSQVVWNSFLQTWIGFFGAPTMIICDSGSEFKGMFERGCESIGIMQHVCIPECPWENSKSERHGGWVKQKLDKEISSGRCSFATLLELDEFLNSLTTTKNRWFHRGGFSPATLVFGELPRVPGELLSDDHVGLSGIADQFEDPLEVDTAAGEFRRRFHIREQAKQLAMEQTSKDAISRAVKAAPHQSRTWAPGQWVYVFRRGRPSQELHPRDRWCGPGVVVLANNRIVYVAMRTRLWRCSPEQLRPAMPAEILGREIASDPGLSELLRQVVSGTRAGAVDVVKEGNPSASEARFSPLDHDDQGCGQLEQVLPSDIPHVPSVSPIPSGVLPVSQLDPPEVQPPPGLERARNTPDPSRRRSITSQATEPEPAEEPLADPLVPGRLPTITEQSEVRIDQEGSVS